MGLDVEGERERPARAAEGGRERVPIEQRRIGLEFEEFKARHGSKAAYLRFHLFRRREAPEVPLSEVEVDHTPALRPEAVDTYIELEERG